MIEKKTLNEEDLAGVTGGYIHKTDDGKWQTLRDSDFKVLMECSGYQSDAEFWAGFTGQSLENLNLTDQQIAELRSMRSNNNNHAGR